MGSVIKMNAILRLTTEQGMPEEPVIGERYGFQVPGERVFMFAPNWVTLVHNVGGKWRFVGQAHVLQQTLDAEAHTTSGEFVVTRLFSEEFSRLASKYEAPEGESFYD